MSSNLIPKNPNVPTQNLTVAGAIPASIQCPLLSVAGTYTLPLLAGEIDGSIVYLKFTGASSSAVINPGGSDTIDSGSTANITLTSAGAGQGLCCIIVASKTLGTWIRLVKPQ
jgi:hypothetical protein